MFGPRLEESREEDPQNDFELQIRQNIHGQLRSLQALA